MHIALLVLHILGAGLLIGVTFLTFLFSRQTTWTPEKQSFLGWLGRFGLWGSAWQLLTGIGLAASEWENFRSNKLFWSKMALYVILGSVVSQLVGRKARALQPGGQSHSLTSTLFIQLLFMVAIVALAVVMVEVME